jgi:hypothetical protein
MYVTALRSTDRSIRGLHEPIRGAFNRVQSTMRRQAIEELQCLGPPTDPALDRAKAVLSDFAPASGTWRTSPPSGASW